MRMAAEQDTKFQEQSNKTAGLAVRIRTCLLLQVLTVTQRKHRQKACISKNASVAEYLPVTKRRN